MPLHDYKCRRCGQEFEALVRASTTPECPECHGRDLERLLSTFGLSSKEKTQAAVRAARAHARRTTWRDQAHAEAEAMRKHERGED
jgi:putative FmdB family regulatory protein